MDMSATGEENIIETDSNKEMKTSNTARNSLKAATGGCGLEDIAGGISITDLTFNDFS